MRDIQYKVLQACNSSGSVKNIRHEHFLQLNQRPPGCKHIRDTGTIKVLESKRTQGLKASGLCQSNRNAWGSHKTGTHMPGIQHRIGAANLPSETGSTRNQLEAKTLKYARFIANIKIVKLQLDIPHTNSETLKFFDEK